MTLFKDKIDIQNIYIYKIRGYSQHNTRTNKYDKKNYFNIYLYINHHIIFLLNVTFFLFADDKKTGYSTRTFL